MPARGTTRRSRLSEKLGAPWRPLSKEETLISKLLRLVAHPVVALHARTGCACTQLTTEGAPSRAAQKRDEWRKSRLTVYVNDFGELAHYRAANARLGAPAPGENRVVFLGDSITEAWALDSAFPGKPYVNRGIAGQTTPQMLLRFRADVIALTPKVVVILAGTNDIAGNTGPMTLAETEANLVTMVELARAHGIKVVLSSVLPVHDYTPDSELAFPLRPPAQIRELNAWLRELAAANGCGYIDYYSAMVDERGLLRRELAADGLHPEEAGFAIMAPLAQQAIEQAGR
jgi:lysophospholipase L1-like esterase